MRRTGNIAGMDATTLDDGVTRVDRGGERPPDGSDQVEEDFRSLMEGLRTTLPGASLVTAFLLTVPLYDKYDQLVRHERIAHYVAFVSAVLGTLLLMAPSSHQRLRSSDGVARRHEHHVQVAVRIAVVGSLLFGVALVATAFLVTSSVLGTAAAAAVAVAVAVTWSWSWYYLPLVSFRREG
jgi:hypothetical protein